MRHVLTSLSVCVFTLCRLSSALQRKHVGQSCGLSRVLTPCIALQGECSEEHVCLPLFAFARKEDADKLEAIADEVLGTEEEGPPSR